jgi:16S rRNA (guanine(966)-N(2))-methyltransferase RsmD
VDCSLLLSSGIHPLRIIAGKFRGRNLKSPPSLEVRPTSDRLRETLFNVIAPRIEGARFLDLCAGSGAVGIEALSRGASHATFVDRSRKMCSLIQSNLELCRIEEDESEVVQSEAHAYLRGAIAHQRGKLKAWDIVFFDPPYVADYLQILDAFGAHAPGLLSENGLLIVEHHHKNQLPDETGSIIRSRILKQGDSALSFYEVSEVDQATESQSHRGNPKPK